MSSIHALPSPADLARQRAQDAQRHREVLHTLIDVAVELAEGIRRKVAAPEAVPGSDAPAKPAPDPTVKLVNAFDRLARAVRCAVTLARELSEPDAEPRPAKASAPADKPGRRDARLPPPDLLDGICRDLGLPADGRAAGVGPAWAALHAAASPPAPLRQDPGGVGAARRQPDAARSANRSSSPLV